MNGSQTYPDGLLDAQIEEHIATMFTPDERISWPPRSGQCYVCGFDYEPILETHHILPQQRGGSSEANNLVALCPTCHRLVHEHLRRHLARTEAKTTGTWYGSALKETNYRLLVEWVARNLSDDQRRRFEALVIGEGGELFLREYLRFTLKRGHNDE